jgi:hypothetical protein
MNHWRAGHKRECKRLKAAAEAEAEKKASLPKKKQEDDSNKDEAGGDNDGANDAKKTTTTAPTTATSTTTTATTTTTTAPVATAALRFCFDWSRFFSRSLHAVRIFRCSGWNNRCHVTNFTTTNQITHVHAKLTFQYPIAAGRRIIHVRFKQQKLVRHGQDSCYFDVLGCAEINPLFHWFLLRQCQLRAVGGTR